MDERKESIDEERMNTQMKQTTLDKQTKKKEK